MYELKLLQINLGHRRAASIDLQLRTNGLDDFICLVQEPWYHKNAVRGLNNQHRRLVATSSVDGPPRALIYCHRDSRVSPCANFTGRDVACGLWKAGMPQLEQVMLISVYWDCKAKNLPTGFTDCLKWCSENRIPVHIGGDLNAHSTLWGGRDSVCARRRHSEINFRL